MEKDKNTDLRSKVIAKAWKDPAFRKKLKNNPKAALKEMGISIPDNVQVHVQEDDARHFTFVLPSAPTNAQELDDAELKRIAAAAVNMGTYAAQRY